MIQTGNAESPSPARTHAAALGFFLLLTGAATWPLPLRFLDRVPGWFVADNYEYLWKMWWFKHALVDLRQTPLHAPHIFYPQGFTLAHAELTPLHTLVGLPLTWLWGEIPAYNFFAALSFVLSGWAAFALLRHWTGNTVAGLLAGVLFILGPYHMVRYGGILPLMAVEGLPVFLLGLDRWLQDRRIRWALLSGLGFLLASWASIYYAFALLLLGPVYALVRVPDLRTFLWARRTWAGLGTLALIAGLTLGPLSLPYLQLGRELDFDIPLEDVDFWSASPTDYLLPPGLHPLWGQWVRERLLGVQADFPQIALEFVLGGGYLGLLFAFYGWRNGNGGARRAVVWFTAAAFVLSLGPRLHIGRHPVVIPAPEGLVSGFHAAMNALGALLPAGEGYQSLAAEGLTLPLPALLVRWLLPPIEGMRAWNRFAAFTSLGASLLAGLGYAAWVRRELLPSATGARSGRRRETVAAVVVLAIAIFELWPGRIPLQAVGPRPVDRWLAGQPGQFTVMELPLISALSAPQLQYSRYHGKRTAFAYGTFFPYWYREQYPELGRCPDPECLTRLRSWDVRYVLLNRAALRPGEGLEAELERSTDLRRVETLEDIVVYRLGE